MRPERIVIVGGPRCGKSQLSKALRAHGFPTFCGDPIDKVKEPEPRVTYLAEGMGMDSASSRYIVDRWLPMPGPWVLEGHIMARVLRKWLDDDARGDEGTGSHTWPCDRIVVFEEQHPDADLSARQVAHHKGVIGTTWRGIAEYFEGMTTTIRWSDYRFADVTPEELASQVLSQP
ncbi:MAG TPA: hypothetical protein VFX94_07385 [Burkholderiales bacterium]|nr:hypothetical protein [Burkholderiales bacterium]